jgi:Na+/H+ antiporter NhaD/arsenite permease-like protein
MLIENPKFITILIFLITYTALIIFYQKKTLIVWIAAVILLLLKLLTPRQALESIDWNVILLYFGMLFVGEVFLFSKMPDFLAIMIASRAKNAGIAMVFLCFLNGLLSTALENVAVVLLVAPIALSIARKCDITPVPLFIGMAISSNLQGAATLIGDPPSMLLAGFTGMNFNDFFFIEKLPSIFFSVQFGAIVSAVVLFLIFKKYDKKMPVLKEEKYLTLIPSIFIALLVFSLILGSSFEHDIHYMSGIICFTFGIISFAWFVFYRKGEGVKKSLANLDWQTGVFLMGIFILVKSLSVAGLMEDAAELILKVSGKNPFSVYMLIVWVSVFLSAFIDNVPFLVAMLPVVKSITVNMGTSPSLLYFGLLIGASVGGNITPIGASANIVSVGILKKQGYSMRFMEFVRIGLPFTIVSVIASSMFTWIVFS